MFEKFSADNELFEDRFYHIDPKTKILQIVQLRLKCRVISVFYNIHKEDLLIIENLSVNIEAKGDNIDNPTNNFQRYSLIISQNDKEILRLYNKDREIIIRWKNKIEEYSKTDIYSMNYQNLQELYYANNVRVLKVLGLKDQKFYAAKILKIAQKYILKSVLYELGIMRRIHHKNLIKLHEVYKQSNQIILIMELADGGNLRQRVKNSTIYSEEKAAYLLKNLLKGIEYLNEHNLIHRDIKPANILMIDKNDDINIKLGDFGISVFNYSNLLDNKSGTPGFYSPEIFTSEKVTHKSDVYSCGLILYFLLTGEYAFKGLNKVEILENNQNGFIEFDNPRINLISSECKTFLKSLLSKSPKDRPTATKALESDWIEKYTKNPFFSLPSINIIFTSELPLLETNLMRVHEFTPKMLSKCSARLLSPTADGTVLTVTNKIPSFASFDNSGYLTKFPSKVKSLVNNYFNADYDEIIEENVPCFDYSDRKLVKKIFPDLKQNYVVQ